MASNKAVIGKRAYIIFGAIFLITLLANILARFLTGFSEWYAVSIYQVIVEIFGRITSIVPFAVSEVMIVVFLVFAAAWLIRAVVRIKNRKISAGDMLVQGLKFIVGISILLFFSFTFTCGINYHRAPFSEAADIKVTEYSNEDLEQLCRYLKDEINKEAEKIQPGNNGFIELPADYKKKAVESMQKLGQQYPALAGYYPTPKPLILSKLLSYQNLEGIYSCFTLEATYNKDIPAYAIMSVMSHELSHLKGFMREDEANFIAYLACTNSEISEFRFSGLMTAYVYSTNQLYKNDVEAYSIIQAELCDTAKNELAAYNTFWQSYEGIIAEVADKINDTYLKANAQTDGVKSYGRMVDLLLAMYKRASSGITS